MFSVQWKNILSVVLTSTEVLTRTDSH